MGRIFAQWGIVYFWQFPEICSSIPHIWATLFYIWICLSIIFDKMDWATTWVIFTQTRQVTLTAFVANRPSGCSANFISKRFF
jgi:hypothetical protein